MIYKYFFKYSPLIKKKFFLIFFLIFFISFLNLLKPIILAGATNFVLEDLKISNQIGLTKNNIINTKPECYYLPLFFLVCSIFLFFAKL